MKKNHVKIAKIIVRWGWNLLFVYLIFVMIMIWQDAKANPELYMLVESRPTTPSMLPNNTDFIVPNYANNFEEWELKANTFDECKPMINLLELYNKWIEPMIYAMVILIVFNILLKIEFKKE